jgi:hypothetical protein
MCLPPPSGYYSQIHLLAENKKGKAKIWLIGHYEYVHYVVRNDSSVTLHDYMDFLRRACKLKRYGDRTISLALTWRNIREEILVLLGTPFLLTP